MLIQDFKINPAWSETDKQAVQSYYKDIWENNEYNKFGIQVEPNDIVVDCGACIGHFSVFATTLGASKVFAFEKNYSAYEYLVSNTKNKNIVCFNGTVSGHPNDYNLDKIFKIFNLNKIDFLKIDIEGDEWSFISNASSEALNKINKIVMELHVYQLCGNEQYKDCKEAFNLMQKLSANNFKIMIEQPRPNTCCYTLYARK